MVRGSRRFSIVLGLCLLGFAAGCGSGDDADDGSGNGESAAVQDERRSEGERPGAQGEGGVGGSGGEGDESRASEEADAEFRREQRRQARASAPTPEEREAEEQAQGFYDILAEEEGDANSTEFDSAGFCDLMSRKARKETVDYAKQASGVAREWDCESAIELLVLRAKRAGSFRGVRRAEIVGVNAEGDRATATVRFGPRAPLTTIPLVREDGEWKLGTSVAAP